MKNEGVGDFKPNSTLVGTSPLGFMSNSSKRCKEKLRCEAAFRPWERNGLLLKDQTRATTCWALLALPCISLPMKPGSVLTPFCEGGDRVFRAVRRWPRPVVTGQAGPDAIWL